MAQEVAPFGIGLTIVEPGGARTEFRYGSAQVADPLPAYVRHPRPVVREDARPGQRPGPGDPARMATAIIDSVDQTPAPLRMVLGSQALAAPSTRSRSRLADFQTQEDLAASTDYPPGE